jgi:hypothetical protein
MNHFEYLHRAIIHGKPGVAGASADSALDTVKDFLSLQSFHYFF